jgi:hypothetical protein
VNETYGTCQSDHAVAFLVPLAVLSLGSLVAVSWKFLMVQSVTSGSPQRLPPSTWHTLVVMHYGLACGLPTLFAAADSPRQYYGLFCGMVSIVCLALVYGIWKGDVVTAATTTTTTAVVASAKGGVTSASKGKEEVKQESAPLPN